MTNIKKYQSLREYADLHRCNEFYKKVFGAVEGNRFTTPEYQNYSCSVENRKK
jgi:hypothetical protein